MFVAGVLALEEEVLVVEDDLTVHVLHEHPEGLRATVDLLIPLEVRGDRQLNLKSAPGEENYALVIVIIQEHVHKASMVRFML